MRAFSADARHPARDRAAVIRALELLRDAEAADIAAAQLTDDDPDLIAACLRLLAVVGRSEHAAAVRPFLADERFFVRAAAITVLGKLGGASDARLIAALDHGGSPWVAIRSAHALADLHATDELASMVGEGGLAADAAIETLYGGAA
jgi:HEAT repeat protein